MATGEVLFTRDGEQDNDIWDDTALVKAYDKAVSEMKDQMGLVTAEKSNNNNNNKTKKNRKKRKSKKKSNRAAAAHIKDEDISQWRLGDRCRAVFSEDGLVYEATIEAITEDSCTVRYCGYGNEEEQDLSELMLPGSDISTGIPSDCNESMEWHNSTAPSETSTPRPGSRSTQGTSSRPGSGRGRGMPGAWPGMSSFPGMPPPFPGMPGGMGGFPMMPPMFPPMASSMPGWSQPPMLPAIPPPPILDEDNVSSDREALHSMLISWYMSGYHTGYYQGLKHGKSSSRGRHQNRRQQKHQHDNSSGVR